MLLFRSSSSSSSSSRFAVVLPAMMMFLLNVLLLLLVGGVVVQASALTTMELKYFNARGAAEVCRLLFAIADEPYTDTRYDITPGTMDSPSFKKAKESGQLDMNLGRAPVLVVDGDDSTIGQSKAIERYLARKFGFMGKNDIEAGQIDCIAEHCIDVKNAQMRKGFSMFNKDKTDDEKAALKKEWFDTDLPTMLGKIETAVKVTSGGNGYSVGSQTSYADVTIFALLRDCTMQADQDMTLQAATSCKLLLSIADRIATNEKIAKWIETRPVTNF